MRTDRLFSCVDTLEISREDLPMADVEEERSVNSASDGEAGTEPVRVGTGRTSINPDTRDVHSASFTCVEVTSDMPTELGEIVDLTQSTSQSTDSNESEHAGY